MLWRQIIILNNEHEPVNSSEIAEPELKRCFSIKWIVKEAYISILIYMTGINFCVISLIQKNKDIASML